MARLSIGHLSRRARLPDLGSDARAAIDVKSPQDRSARATVLRREPDEDDAAPADTGLVDGATQIMAHLRGL